MADLLVFRMYLHGYNIASQLGGIVPDRDNNRLNRVSIDVAITKPSDNNNKFWPQSRIARLSWRKLPLRMHEIVNLRSRPIYKNQLEQSSPALTHQEQQVNHASLIGRNKHRCARSVQRWTAYRILSFFITLSLTQLRVEPLSTSYLTFWLFTRRFNSRILYNI